MAATGRADRPAILIDLGGVLVRDHLPEAARAWGDRLGIAPHEFLAALYGGSDAEVLIGRTTEAAWWSVVTARLGIGESVIAEIRRDLAARQTWDGQLLACLRRVCGRAAIAIVSNAWPATRSSLTGAGLCDLADAVILSCEVGCAKPDRRIFEIALRSVGADPGRALFVDDTRAHVVAAQALGMTAHLHADTPETVERIEAMAASAPG